MLEGGEERIQGLVVYTEFFLMRLLKYSAIRVVWFYDLGNMSKKTMLRKGDVYAKQIIFPWNKITNQKVLGQKT